MLEKEEICAELERIVASEDVVMEKQDRWWIQQAINYILKKPYVLALSEVQGCVDALWTEVWFQATDKADERRDLMICANYRGSIMIDRDSTMYWQDVSNQYNKPYGVRMWSKKPTKKQMEKTPWRG